MNELGNVDLLSWAGGFKGRDDRLEDKVASLTGGSATIVERTGNH